MEAVSIMLISDCDRQGASVVIPATNYAVSGQYKQKTSNGDSRATRYLVNTPPTSISDDGHIDLKSYGKYIVTMDVVPGSNRVIFGCNLTMIDYVTKTILYTNSGSATNFKYVICIDASTCIAADDSTTILRLYDLKQIVAGNNVFSNNMIGAITSAVNGLAAANALQAVIIGTKRKVFIQSMVNINQKSIDLSADSFDVAVSFESTFQTTTVVINHGTYSHGWTLRPLTDPSWIAGDSFELQHKYQVNPILYGLSRDGKYLALLYKNEIALYEKKPCHTSCATCSGNTSTSCITCKPTKYLYSDFSCANCDPANGYLVVNSTLCMACDPSCATCYANLNQCSTCQTNYCQSGSICTPCSTCPTECTACSTGSTCTSCATGYFLSGTGCVSCETSCVTCTGFSACTSCKTGYYLGTNGTCTSCTDGYFIAGTACQACTGTCLTCSSAAVCTTCSSPLVLSGTNDTCADCGLGYYKSSTTPQKCYKCDSNCISCSIAATSCTSCGTGKYISVNDSTCVSCSSDGIFPVAANSTCQTCDSNCKTCSVLSTKCLTCNTGKSISVLDDTCIACGSSSFTENNVCKSCSSNCGNCSITAANCTNCTSSSEVVSAINRTCGPCNPGYFVSAGLCYHCDLNCLTCETDTTNCLSCNAPLLLSSANRSCSDCGDGFFVGGDKVCYPCDPGCKTCAATSSACLSCNIGSYLQETQQKCVPCTAAGQRVKGVYCQDCTAGWNCYRCDSDPSVCNKCSGNDTIMTADNNKCGNNCNATGGSYIETVSGVSYCKQCDSSCGQCKGGGTFNCTVCAGTRQWSGGECKLCDSHCSECSSPTVCITCDTSYLMTASSACIDAPTCRQGKSYVSGNHCLNCSANCKSCFGSAASCTSCIAGQYLSATNTCVPCTENGYYHNSTNCLQCDSSCLTCNGSTSTDCLSCSGLFVLADDSSCQPAPPFHLLAAAFKSDMDLATFTFEAPIRQMSSPPAVGLYTCSAAKLKALLASSPSLPGSDSGCTQVERWRVKEMTVEGAHVKVKLSIDQSLDNGVLALRAPEKAYWQSDSNHLVRYPEDYLIVENVTVIKSALDGMMDSAAAPATAAMTTVQIIVMTVSLPQAFILMKVLQTLDYYIYIDCKYPSNFAKFLDMITNSAFDYLPNFFEMLVDNDGLPLYERFAEYGMKVHIFANLGQIYSVALIIGSLKLVLLMLRRIWSKVDKVYNMVGPDLFFGIFESYHLDSVLSVTIFIANRDQLHNRQDAVKYLVIVFVSLFSLFMISMYLFMGYTVSRLTDSYFKHAVVEVRHMKAESWRFLLEDKNMHGNIFQRHFNLIQLFKDIVFAALLYALYYKPLVLIILLTLIQAVFTTFSMVYAPYSIDWMNISLKATQALYLMLDLFFLVLIGWGDEIPESKRYYVIGFSMIVLVLLILGCNIGFSLYSTFKELRNKWRRQKAKKARDGKARDLVTMKSSLPLNVSINSVAPIGDETGINLNDSQYKSEVTSATLKGKTLNSNSKATKIIVGNPSLLRNLNSSRSLNDPSVIRKVLTYSTKKKSAARADSSIKLSSTGSPPVASFGSSLAESKVKESPTAAVGITTPREKPLRFVYLNKKSSSGQPTRL